MPYIKQERRGDMVENGSLKSFTIDTAGELNYAITYLINEYMVSGESYQRYNDVIGALEGAKLELYRRKIAPYEDIKIKSNGDVY